MKVILFGLTIFTIYLLSVSISIFAFDLYEPMWGKGITLQVSLWFIVGVSLIGMLFFWIGSNIKLPILKRTEPVKYIFVAVLGTIYTILMLIISALKIPGFTPIVLAFILPLVFGTFSQPLYINNTEQNKEEIGA